MNNYRKKPVVIEAVHFLMVTRNYFPVFAGDTSEVPKWIIEATAKEPHEVGSLGVHSDGTLWVKTLEGALKVSYGDWIIQGVKGELYPCKPDIFDATYELVEG